MLTEIALLCVIALLVVGIIVQSYLLFSLSQTVSLLKSAPDSETARILLRAVKPKKKEDEQKKSPLEVAPADLSEEGIANLRKMQDNPDHGR